MDKEKRAETSLYVGAIVLFVSCWGISIYDESQYDEYSTYQDKTPFEVILASSWVVSRLW